MGLRNGQILLIDYDSAEIEKKIHVLFGEVKCITMSNEDNLALASGNDGNIVAFCPF